MSKKKLQLNILTPLGIIFDQEVDQVTVTTTSGEISILVDHIPIITTLKVGKVMVRNDGDEPQFFAINGGVLEKRQDNKVIILSSRSESALDIDIDRAQEAYENAQQLMEEADDSMGIDYSNLQEVMSKELNRVRLGQKGMRK
jgi:F-type H+-transporting ATPase subunit epsilon